MTTFNYSTRKSCSLKYLDTTGPISSTKAPLRLQGRFLAVPPNPQIPYSFTHEDLLVPYSLSNFPANIPHWSEAHTLLNTTHTQLPHKRGVNPTAYSNPLSAYVCRCVTQAWGVNIKTRNIISATKYDKAPLPANYMAFINFDTRSGPL